MSRAPGGPSVRLIEFEGDARVSARRPLKHGLHTPAPATGGRGCSQAPILTRLIDDGFPEAPHDA